MTNLKELLDPKIIKLVSVFYNNKAKLYHLTHLAKEANIPSATALRLIKQLVSSDIVKVVPVGKLKIYSYNDTEENNKFMELLKL